MVGPVIYTYGTEAQKARFLPRILSGDDWWCQGYSEPGAGSDLANVRTRAVRDGDHYVVNGHKTWTTLAQHADWIFALVRTNPAAKAQQGISFLLIDMASPRSEEHTSELQSLMRISYAVFCLKKKTNTHATPRQLTTT